MIFPFAEQAIEFQCPEMMPIWLQF